MSAALVPGGCAVALKEPAGQGPCNWPTGDHRHLVCAAHRKRKQLHGDYLAHVPVTRKPSRKPEAVASRLAERRLRRAVKDFADAHSPVLSGSGRLVLF